MKRPLVDIKEMLCLRWKAVADLSGGGDLKSVKPFYFAT